MAENILLTGATGFIGSRTVGELCRSGFDVTGVSRGNDVFKDSHYHHVQADLTDARSCGALFEGKHFDRVVHMAALAHSDSAYGRRLSWDDYYRENVMASENVFREALRKKIPVLYISTVDVYGFAENPVSAHTRREPVSGYARSKAMAENVLVKMAKLYDTPASIFRLAPVYSDEQKRDIQKRYYLKAPYIGYMIGSGIDYEVLSVDKAAREITSWCLERPARCVRIIRDEQPLRTARALDDERKAGRAKIVLRFPKCLCAAAADLALRLGGRNGFGGFTYLLHKAVCPMRSITSGAKPENRGPKLLFVSSSGGHFEQLKMLRPLMDRYPSAVVTERTPASEKADYLMEQISHTDPLILFKFAKALLQAAGIFRKEDPDYIISTGSMIALPFAMLAKLKRRKIIFIETFAVREDLTLTGKWMYGRADLFIVQWRELQKKYPGTVYGGCIY